MVNNSSNSWKKHPQMILIRGKNLHINNNNWALKKLEIIRYPTYF